MAERIVTDAHGDRWDVRQKEADDALRFRHQSGREVFVQAEGQLYALSNAQLLDLLNDARRAEGEPDPEERRGRAQSLDPEGYTTN